MKKTAFLTKYYYFLICLAVFVIGVGIGSTSNNQLSVLGEEIDNCYLNNKTNDAAQVDCWMGLMKDSYSRGGTEKAFEIFQYIYDNYDGFANSGCHRQAHRVGDFAYYFDYLSHKNFDLVQFPKSANACGYGFYHGFIEHLVQDNPEVSFVKNTCQYLISRLNETAPDIAKTCYHGSGHGFLIAEADEIVTKEPINIVNVTNLPIKKCSELQVAEEYIAECHEGVFNVFIDWMVEGNYGLKYDNLNPFVPCEALLPDELSYQACSIEISRKFDSLSGYEPAKVLALIKKNPFTQIHDRMFQIGVTGIVQHNPKDGPLSLTTKCRELDSEYQEQCFSAVVLGIFSHGNPREIYLEAEEFCSSEYLTVGERSLCYKESAQRIKRFYSVNEIIKLCGANSLSVSLCQYVEPDKQTEGEI